jgi:DNA-binding transcriptional LysR family regulator
MHLLVFVTVAEKKNFSRAAETLSLTQPAISQQIHALEEYYGSKLFERTSKRVELTRAGETLLPYAKQILELTAAAKGAVDDLVDRVTGRMTIGATLTIGEYILPQVLAQYTRRYPEVEVEMVIANTEEIGEMALNLRLDAALVEGRFVHKSLMLTPFLEDEMVLVAPAGHPLTEKREIRVDDLASESFVLREVGSGTRVVAEEVLDSLGVQPAKLYAFGSTQAIKEAVEAGMGLTILSKWCIRKEESFGTLRRLTIPGFTFTRPLWILKRSGQFQTRAVAEFIDLVKSYAYPSA